MAEPTYFLRNCTIVFCWVFHRQCKNLRLFNFLYESLSSTFYAPLLFFSHNQIFPPLVYKLKCMVYVYTIGQNFSKVLPEIHGDGAMKSCSAVRENKTIAQFLQPFNPCPCFVSSFRRQRFSLTFIS